MADSRSNMRIKKYGVCLNDKCEKYKEIQEVVHGDMECPECHKKLSPCAPPKKKADKKPIYIGVAAVVIVGLILACVALCSKGTNDYRLDGGAEEVVDSDSIARPDTVARHDTIVQRDTVVVRDTIVKKDSITEVKTKSVNPGNGNLKLSYGTYSGATKNGYPHGQGRLTYSTTRQINRRDVKGRMAKAGEYVIGEFHNGFLVYGKHYDADGSLLGSLNVGAGPEDIYESK